MIEASSDMTDVASVFPPATSPRCRSSRTSSTSPRSLMGSPSIRLISLPAGTPDPQRSRMRHGIPTAWSIWCCSAPTPTAPPTARISQDWQFYSQLVARLLLGWTETEAAEAFSELVRRCTTPEFAARALSATSEFSVSHLLRDVTVPTLVLHRPEQRTSSMDNARALAAGIPDVRLSLQPGESIAPYLGDTDAIVREIDAFLTGRQPTDADTRGDAIDYTSLPPGLAISGGISTVVFTDVVASTELVERLGDEAARAALRSLEDATTETASRRTGRVVKHLGDGSLLEFASTSAALKFAAELQASSTAIGLDLTIGVAVGEPIREDGDLHGSIVVLASRITAAAGAGEVLVSDAVRQLVQGKGFEFGEVGARDLKGFAEPVRLWQLSV